MKHFSRTTLNLRHMSLFGALSLVSFLTLPSLILAAAGDLDPSFGIGGIVITRDHLSYASAMAVQADGKIIVVGEGATGDTWDFAVVRYNTDGALDSSFGGTGIVLTSIGNSHDQAFAVAIQADGKIVVAGGSCNGAGNCSGAGASFAVVRYDPNGSLDTSLNGTGIVTTSFGNSFAYAFSVASQTDGKIVAAGRSGDHPDTDFAVVRYNADGSLDTSFNGMGIVITPVGNSIDSATSVAIQTDGKIVVAGYSFNEIEGSSFAVVRYRTNGLLDHGFHAAGKVLTPFGNGFSGAGALAIQSDGKIVAAGYSDRYPNSDFAVVRYNSTGVLDNSFGNAGKAVFSVGAISDFANCVAIQLDGKIVAAGKSFTGTDGEFAAVRLDPNGSLDTTFNGTGKVITNTVGNDASSVVIQEDGKIVVAGGYDDDISSFVLVRYLGGPVKGKIAFTSDRDGNQEIYVVNDDGTRQRRLTNDPGTDCFPTFSPNGRKIAFVSENSSGSFAIKLMNTDGTDQRELTPLVFTISPTPWMEAFSLSWSPDGRKIAFQENGDIFSVNIDGSDRLNLTRDPALDSEPAWSPDGLQILFISSRETFRGMFTMRTDGSDVRALPRVAGLSDRSPEWAPNGNKIVFAAENEDFGPVLYTADADGTNRQLFDNTMVMGYFASRYKPKWSPDGSRIVFHIGFGDNTEIFTKNADGSGFRYLTDTIGRNYQPSWQPPLHAGTIADFDGDGRSDISVFRPSDRIWYLDRSTDGFAAVQFGLSTDKIVPADFDGDGRTDISVYRDGTWYWLGSGDGGFHSAGFGLAGDVPAAADYDGDGIADISVFRPSDGTWYRQNSSNGQFAALQFGRSGDVPMPGDHDGDGKTDITVFRPENGYWYIFRSSDNEVQTDAFGTNGDIPVNGDFNGDGRADLAVFRPSDATWYIARPTGVPAQNFDAIQFGLSTDIPAPADYDGDGKTDLAVYRSGTWYLLQSTGGFAATQFGVADDKPIAAAYLQR